MHGNTNLEICKKCGKHYLRDFRVRNSTTCGNHKTGRFCDNHACGGNLHDTIINFGENLRDSDLNIGYKQGKKADVMLCVGSSLRVTPAADMAEETPDNGGKLVIINLQKTPLDKKAALCIYAKIDDVFELLMKKLDMKIPEFRLRRYGELKLKGEKVFMNGIDPSGAPYQIFKRVKCTHDENNANVNVTFQGHYNEPELDFKMSLKALTAEKNQTCRIRMVLNPFERTWETVSVMNWKCTEAVAELKHKNIANALAAPDKNQEPDYRTGKPIKSNSSNRSSSTAASGRLNAPAKRAPEKKTSPARLAPEKKEAPKRGKSISPASRAPRPCMLGW